MKGVCHTASHSFPLAPQSLDFQLGALIPRIPTTLVCPPGYTLAGPSTSHIYRRPRIVTSRFFSFTVMIHEVRATLSAFSLSLRPPRLARSLFSLSAVLSIPIFWLSYDAPFIKRRRCFSTMSSSEPIKPEENKCQEQ